MKRSAMLLAGIVVLATPALAQVSTQLRPADCVPALPVVDEIASVAPQDVIADPAAPAVAAKRRFLGLPLILPALAGIGGLAALVGDNDDEPQNVSPA